ncbi:MAG TPA: AAA family ATPase [Nostocaceae cyanobacterium]|nr:AAA family ATPase [Nostocaceae cyanobacterium]
MLKRIYIDNFRTLVNFELNFDSINLFLGGNGSGKSSVFDVLRKIQTFIIGDRKVEGIFKASDCTRWRTYNVQYFELEIAGNGGNYRYELHIEFTDKNVYVELERLSFNQDILLEVNKDEAQIFEGGSVSKFSYAAHYSLMSDMLMSDSCQKIARFRKRIERFIIVQIIPSLMIDGSEKEDNNLTSQMENFVSWYRYISQDQGKISEIMPVLKEVIDGFVSFKFEQFRENYKVLKLRFASEVDKANIIEYYLSELSDGQKTILALYTLLYATKEEDYTLCIDEPEAFLALPEIQPWLIQLYDFCSERKLQALLISHHPEFINYLLASPIGYWFERDSNTATRVRKVSNDEAEDTGLKISQLIERGWL